MGANLPVALSTRILQASRRLPANVGKKNSPQRLAFLLEFMSLMPVIAQAAAAAGISTTSIKYWLQKSHLGAPGDGFDVTWQGEKVRFHEGWEEAVAAGNSQVERAAFEMALGFNELGVYRGRVQYQYDPDLVALGFGGAEAYLRDDKGKPIPEVITKQDPEMIRWLLERRMREQYGKAQDVNVHHTGGVLVVGVRAKTSAELDERAKQIASEPAVEVEFREVEPEEA